MKAFLKILIILALELGVYFGLTQLKFDFTFSFITAFFFSLLFAALILEGALIKNIAFYTFALINFVILLALFFAIPGFFTPDQNKVSQKNFAQIQKMKESVALTYPKGDAKKMQSIWDSLTFMSYPHAGNEIKKLSQKSYLAEYLDSYRLKKTKELNSKIALAKKIDPRFDSHVKLLIAGKYPEFMAKIEYARAKDPIIEEFYGKAKELLSLKNSKELFKQKLLDEIEKFLKDYSYSGELIYQLIYFFPEIQPKYSNYLVKFDLEKISYLDLKGFSEASLETRNLFTFCEQKEKGPYLIKAASLIEPSTQYPFLATNIELISAKGEKAVIPFAKISRNTLVYPVKPNVFSSLHFPGIHYKLKNTLELIKKPLNPFWLFQYKNDYPEVFKTVIKPFWIEFIKFWIAFFSAFGLALFIVLYIKTIYPKKLHFLFFFLPVLFLLIISLIFSHFIIKLVQLIF